MSSFANDAKLPQTQLVRYWGLREAVARKQDCERSE
jgi:hypothetical protein